MKVLHLSERVAPFGSLDARARAVAELAPAQQGVEEEVLVVGLAPVSKVEDLSSPQQFARRLEPLSVPGEAGTFEAHVLESTLVGTGIRLYLLVLPPGHPTTDFATAALTLARSLPQCPGLLHLHGETGMDPDSAREELEGVSLVQSVYGHGGSELLAKGVQDADEVVVPCGDLAAPADPGGDPARSSPVAEALAAHTHPRVVTHGIDLVRWDPSRDSALPGPFDTESLEGKVACKRALQERAGLAPRADAPILALWSNGGETGGLELVTGCLREILALDLQVVVLPGEEVAEADLEPMEGERVWRVPPGDDRGLRLALAGSDLVLLPDGEAPLGQRALIATRYGVVPVARHVGAHRDRLVEYDGLSNTGGAFLFDDPLEPELLAALGRARRLYADQTAWAAMLCANGAVDMGWARAAAQLHEIYNKAAAK